MYDGSFHEAIGLVLAVGQCFGIMPVRGIYTKSPTNLRFTKCSLRFLWCIFLSLGFAATSSLTLLWISRTNLKFGKLINFIFDFSSFASLICFLDLAKKWPKLMIRWKEVEKFLPELKYQMDKQKMAHEIKMIALWILVFSMGKKKKIILIEAHNLSISFTAEHLLSIAVGAHGANNCPSIPDPIRAFYVANYPQVFQVFPYNGYLGFFTKFLNVCATFSWGFTDVFVMIVSIGLATKFKHINHDLLQVKGMKINPGFWSEYRLYYRELVSLVLIVDEALAKIILISISNNLFFVCVQLLRTLE